MNNQHIIVHKNFRGKPSNIQLTDNFVKLLRNYLSSYHRVFIVRGEHSYVDCGAADFMSQVQQVTSCEYYHFTSFARNPKQEDAIVGVQEMIAYNADIIIAIGGGSAMDVAKLIRYYSQQPIPLIAIPTTAGTGAESTQFAVCYVDGIKTSIDHPSILPDIALLISEFTMSGNQYLTATCGFDAFAQAVEAYWNIHATEESDLYAEEALVLLTSLLYRFAEEPVSCMNNKQWRDQMLVGANLSGQAINITRTTAPHAMSYVLTSKYNYPHGHAVALTFPFWAKLNMECTKEEYMGQDHERYREKMKWLRKCLNLRETQDIEESLRLFMHRLALGYDKNRHIDPNVVAKSVNMQRAGNNPHVLSDGILLQAAEAIIK